jgi:DNA-binding helix-hairpin-helix protein with protein kinase domain
MAQILFLNDLTKTRKMIYWSSLLMLVLLAAGLIIMIVGGKPLFIYVDLITGSALIIFSLSFAFLLSVYLSKQEVREKRNLIHRLKQNLTEMETEQNHLVAALQKKKAASEQYEELKAQEKQTFTNQTDALQQKTAELKQALENELHEVLAGLQNQYLESGLRAVPLDPAHIPGIGEALAKKLHLSGVQTAWDVTQGAIQAIPGIGESKALSIIRWRESFENSLHKDQPTTLPEEMAEAINKKYADHYLAIQAEISEVQASYNNAIEQLREKEAKEVVAAESMETKARQALATLETQKQDFQNQVAQYRSITFPNFFLAILTTAQSNWGKKVWSYLVFAGYFILGIANVVLLINALIQSRM